MRASNRGFRVPAEPFSATLLGGALINVGCGLITNFVESGRQGAVRGVLNWWGKGKTPANHDVLKVTHEAYVAAMHIMAKRAAHVAQDEADKAAAKTLKALCNDAMFANFRWDGEHLPLAATGTRIDALFDQRAPEDETGWNAYNTLILDDLTIWGIPRTDNFNALFLGGIEGMPPWHLCFRECFAEMLKADSKKPVGERAFRILTFEALTELKGRGAELADGVQLILHQLDRMEGKLDEIKAIAESLAAQLKPDPRTANITDEALLALAGKIAQNISDPQQALAALDRAIDEFLRIREQAERGTNLGDLVNRTLRAMAAANERGAFDDGADAGASAFADWQAQQQAAKQEGLRLIDANIEQHRLRFDAAAMAHWIVERMTLDGGPPSFDALRRERYRWYERGSIHALSLDLSVSIELAELAIARAISPADRADGQNNLGIALWTQGERTGGAEGLSLLARAVAAYDAALTVRTQAETPADWAMTQNNLGIALRAQGERSNGAQGLSLLARAVTAFDAALTVHTQAEMPAQWATIQNNLGNALSTQGERSDGAEGLTLLARAGAAYNAALTVRTRTDRPAQWAMTQNNLGNALQAQGKRTDEAEGLLLLARAVAAYDAALTVRTQADRPADWATTQNNLGAALRALGERIVGAEGLSLLARAVAAYDAALTVHAQAEMPADWAMTKFNIAIARLAQANLCAPGAVRGFLNAARVAVTDALIVFTPEHMGFDHEQAMQLLTKIDARIAALG